MAAKKTYTIGLSKIEVGAIAEDGGMGDFNFSIMNPSVTVLADLLGGVGTPGTGSTPDKWEAPDKIPVIEKSVRITPEQGLKFEIPRMKLVSKINATFSKSGILLIEVAGTVLQPTKTGTKKITATLMTAADVQA